MSASDEKQRPGETAGTDSSAMPDSTLSDIHERIAAASRFVLEARDAERTRVSDIAEEGARRTAEWNERDTRDYMAYEAAVVAEFGALLPDLPSLTVAAKVDHLLASVRHAASARASLLARDVEVPMPLNLFSLILAHDWESTRQRK